MRSVDVRLYVRGSGARLKSINSSPNGGPELVMILSSKFLN